MISANAQFWEQMLAIKLEPVPMAEIFCVGTRHLRGSVELSGVWNGRIEVHIDERLALCATAAMLMQPIETVCEDDTLDATKEIVNMIAGVIKSSLPRPCTMTVPNQWLSRRSAANSSAQKIPSPWAFAMRMAT